MSLWLLRTLYNILIISGPNNRLILPNVELGISLNPGGFEVNSDHPADRYIERVHRFDARNLEGVVILTLELHN